MGKLILRAVTQCIRKGTQKIVWKQVIKSEKKNFNKFIEEYPDCNAGDMYFCVFISCKNIEQS